MLKQKFEMEFTMRASTGLIFPRVSTASGLNEWFGDNVSVQRKVFTFEWANSKQKAHLLFKKRNSARFQWFDDAEDGYYFEFRVKKSEFTRDTALIITDFAANDELVEMRDLWAEQVNDLKRLLGG